MGAHRRARSARAAARVALCVVALLAAASGASAVSLSETDKRAAHESHHARKARLREELAAAELATREKYEAKVSSLERTTERLRREANKSGGTGGFVRCDDVTEIGVEPTPATHSVWTVLQAGETLYQTGELLETL